MKKLYSILTLTILLIMTISFSAHAEAGNDNVHFEHYYDCSQEQEEVHFEHFEDDIPCTQAFPEEEVHFEHFEDEDIHQMQAFPEEEVHFEHFEDTLIFDNTAEQVCYLLKEGAIPKFRVKRGSDEVIFTMILSHPETTGCPYAIISDLHPLGVRTNLELYF